MSRPPAGAALADAASVLWTWLVAVALVYSVQLGAGLGNPSMGLALSSAALPAALVAATPVRARRWAMAGTVAALGLLAVANAVYHGFFGDYIPLAMIGAADQLLELDAYAPALLAPRHAAPLLAVLGTAALALGLRPDPAAAATRRARAPLAATLVAAAPAVAWASVVAPGTGDTQTGGFLYAHLIDARVQLADLALAGGPSPDEMRRVLALTEPPPSGGEADRWRGAAAGSSVLLLQVEALNDWVIDADVEGVPVTPFLRSLARRGLRFTRVYDDVHLGRSSDADLLVMASQHPLERGAVAMTRARADVLALPDVLREQGYATLSAHAHHRAFWNAGARHAAYGFETSLFAPELGEGETVGFGLADGVFLQRVEPRVAGLPRPFLAWLITMTMHGPHDAVPASFGTIPLGPLEDTPMGRYLLKARHTDDAIRGLVEALERDGALARTTLVVYGDHTESFGFDAEELRRRARVADGPPDLQRLELDRVAMIVVPPDAPAEGLRVETAGTLLDVAPTLLHLLGLPAPRAFLGRSLLPEGPGFAAQVTGEVVAGDVIWAGAACYAARSRSPLPERDCAAARARAREQLEGSWLITRHRLSARLSESGPGRASALR